MLRFINIVDSDAAEVDNRNCRHLIPQAYLTRRSVSATHDTRLVEPSYMERYHTMLHMSIATRVKDLCKTNTLD
jgi:hypothetical protein